MFCWLPPLEWTTNDQLKQTCRVQCSLLIAYDYEPFIGHLLKDCVGVLKAADEMCLILGHWLLRIHWICQKSFGPYFPGRITKEELLGWFPREAPASATSKNTPCCLDSSSGMWMGGLVGTVKIYGKLRWPNIMEGDQRVCIGETICWEFLDVQGSQNLGPNCLYKIIKKNGRGWSQLGQSRTFYWFDIFPNVCYAFFDI